MKLSLKTLRARLIALVACTIGLAVGPSLIFWYRAERSDHYRAVTELADVLAASAAANLEYPLSIGDHQAIESGAEKLARQEDVLYVLVTGEDGEIKTYHRAPAGRAAGCAEDPKKLTCREELVEAQREITISGESDDLWAEGAAPKTSTLGSVRVGIGLARSNRRLRDQTASAVLFVLVAALIIFAVAGALAGVLARPLRELRRATEAMAGGALSARVNAGGSDEIAALGASFNEMAGHLECAQKKLADSARRLGATFGAMKEYVLVVDASGLIVMANEALAKAVGVAPDLLPGRLLQSVLTLENDASSSTDGNVLGRDNVLIPVQISRSQIVLDRGEATLYVAGDLREAKLAKELAVANQHLESLLAERLLVENKLREATTVAIEASRLKSEFLANMSHEIRTPMNGVIGMTSLLLTAELPRETREWVETIRTSSESLLTLINDILDFSKIEAGRMELEEVTFDLSEVMSDAMEIVSGAGYQKGLELVVTLDPAVPRSLRGDPARLRQVLVNLCSNAVKFTAQGTVKIAAKYLGCDGERARVVLEVSDTGMGIPDSARERIFDAFRQVDGSTTRKFGGTGLGLAISRQLTRLMNGEIALHSTLGKGSTFALTVAFEVAEPEPERSPLVNAPILCASPAEETRRAIAAAVRAAGLETREASTLDEIAALSDGCAGAVIDHRFDGAKLAAIPVLRLAPPGALRLENFSGEQARLPLRRSRLLDALCALRLLSAPVKGTSPTEDPRLANQDRARWSSLRVLVADDNRVNQKVALHLLGKLGLQPSIVENGLQALEALAREPFDCVFMDCQMPELDGYEATRILRAKEGPSRDTLVVAMTANALKGDREKCLAAGMDDYVAKPVRLEDLETVLSRWLGSRAETASAA